VSYPKIVAHRGVSSVWPENSLIAFEKAVEIRADGVECDLRRTADGRIVLMHDASIDRTTRGTGYVFALTFAEVRRHAIKDPRQPDRAYPDQRVPSLAEFLDLMGPSGLELRIELKEVGFEEEVVQQIRERGLADRTVLTSFLPAAIQTVKSCDRSIRTGLITSRFSQVRYEVIRPDIDAVDFGVAWEFSREMYQRAKSDGLTLDVWTIDDPEQFRSIAELAPDYVTTNFPQRFLPGSGRGK